MNTMNSMALSRDEIKTLKSLSSKKFNKMTSKEKEAFLELGAKDFSKRFAEIIQKLANE